MKNYLLIFYSFLLILIIQMSLYSSDDLITQESIDKAKSTETIKPTAQMIKEKVNMAVALIEKEGEASFPKFKGKNSDFIYSGTYIWIHSMDDGAIMLMHPMKPKIEGKEQVAVPDSSGKMFFAEMNEICREKGEGWVEYEWPKPGEKEPSKKISFVKLAKHNGKEYVVGSGAYDITMDYIQN